MYMDEGLDTGDILLQSRLEIAPDETGGSLHDRLAQIAPAALDEALAATSSGKRSSDSAGFRSRHLCTQARARTMAASIGRKPAAMIERKIRAFDPWPGAFTPSAR